MAALTLALAASLACSAAAAAPPAAAAATSATFSNIEPRRDTQGQIIDAHDGNYQLVNGTWHYFAMGYGLCNDTGTVNGCDPKCGYSPANTVNVWTSPDLSNSNWTKLAEVLPYADRPNGTNCTYFRSHGAFSKASQKWVVWVNAVNCPAIGHGGSGYLAATAPHPAGPWSYAGVVKTKTHDSRLGDMDIFVDDDGTGYAMLTRCCGSAPKPDDRRMVVEKLSPDFLSGVAASETFGVSWTEAPTLFKRKGVYYGFSAGCTCFGLGGAGVSVNYAKSPLGPWTTGAASIDPGCKDWSTCGAGQGGRCEPVTQAQQNAVITIPADASSSSALEGETVGARYIWTGDRWQSGGNGTGAPAPGLKGWDYQTWLPLEWDDSVDPPLPKALQWVDSFPI